MTTGGSGTKLIKLTEEQFYFLLQHMPAMKEISNLPFYTGIIANAEAQFGHITPFDSPENLVKGPDTDSWGGWKNPGYPTDFDPNAVTKVLYSSAAAAAGMAPSNGMHSANGHVYTVQNAGMMIPDHLMGFSHPAPVVSYNKEMTLGEQAALQALWDTYLDTSFHLRNVVTWITENGGQVHLPPGSGQFFGALRLTTGHDLVSQIKLVKRITKWGLKDAKDYVEIYANKGEPLVLTDAVLAHFPLDSVPEGMKGYTFQLF